MKLGKSILILVSVLFISLSTYAQTEQTKTEKEQEIKYQKIAFFTDKIGLTSEEAQMFWPIYNEYWAKKNMIIKNRKSHMTDFANNNKNMNNDEMVKQADQYIHYEIELAELLNEYHNKFKKILPIEKVMRIYLADYEFKTYLLKKIRESGKED
jgi:hypothetical protein